MMKAAIKVEQVLLPAQWVDNGRRFAQVDGYSQSGALDYLHHNLANARLQNTFETPTIEVMGGQFAFSVNTSLICCVSGAKATLSLSSNKKPLFDTPFEIKAGETLHIGNVENGLFCYIAFSVKPILALFRNSVCAVKREKSGGVRNDGAGLRTGDVIQMDVVDDTEKSPRDCLRPCSKKTVTKVPMLENLQKEQARNNKHIPICFSYQHEMFSTHDKSLFLHQQYEVTSLIDKMGAQLTGQPLSVKKTKLLSQGIAKGSIQITGAGLPIIMRNDRQTIGGYPIIGTVTSIGLIILSQAKPQDTIQFIETSFENALTQTRLLWQVLKNISTN